LSRCNMTTHLARGRKGEGEGEGGDGGRLVENKKRARRCARLSRGPAVESTARAYIPLEGSPRHDPPRPWQESAADVLTFREKTSVG
jgi:hypothetical protein